MDIYKKLVTLSDDMKKEVDLFIDFLKSKIIFGTLDFGRFLWGKMIHIFIIKPRHSYGYVYVCFFDLNHFSFLIKPAKPKRSEYIAQKDTNILTRRKAGLAKALIEMRDDFDEPLEDFKEYME